MVNRKDGEYRKIAATLLAIAISLMMFAFYFNDIQITGYSISNNIESSNNEFISLPSEGSGNIMSGQPPEITSIKLNATYIQNSTDDNLLFNYTISDNEGDPLKGIVNWYKGGQTLSVINMPFEGGSTSSWTRDYSYYGNNGSVIGATWNSASGHDGKGSYYFDGNDDYINIPSDSSLDGMDEITISVWVKMTGGTSLYRRVIQQSGTTTSTYIIDRDSNNKWRACVTNKSNDFACVISDDSIISDTWYHIAAVYNGSSVIMLLNGSLQSSQGSLTGSINSDEGHLRIGLNSENLNNDFRGYIDDLQILSKALSVEQIQAIYEGDNSIISSEETSIGDTWHAEVTPNDGSQDGTTNTSNNITISDESSGNNLPTITSIKLNATSLNNYTTDNLTLNYSVYDAESDPVKPIINWYRNDTSITVLNMPFEGGSNSTLTKDYSGYNNGTVVGATWQSTSGHDGFGAYDFDGNDDGIKISSSEELNFYESNEFTITGWFSADQNPSTNDRAIIASTYTTSNTNMPYYITTTARGSAFGTSDGIIFGIYDGTWHSVSSGFLPEIDRWYFFAATYDGNNIKLFIDKNDSVDAAFTNGVPYDNDEVNIGRLLSSGTYYYNWDGMIDDIKFFNYSLSENQIRLLYEGRENLILSEETETGNTWHAEITPNDGTQDGIKNISNQIEILPYVDTNPPSIYFNPPTYPNSTELTPENNSALINISIIEEGLNDFIFNWDERNNSIYDDSLVFAMNFDNISSIGENQTKTVDISKYGNNGTCTNMGTYCNYKDGKHEKGIYLDGSNDFIDFGNLYSPQIGGKGANLTISIWMKSNSLPASDWDSLFSKDYISGYTGYGLYISNQFPIFTYRNGTHYGLSVNSEQNVNDNQWHHIAGTFDGSTGTSKIYIDGILSGNITRPGNLIEKPTEVNLLIGKQDDPSPHYYTGFVDEPRIYNKTLNQDEIWMQYSSNLKKYDVNKWEFFSNYSNISVGTHTYIGFAEDNSGNMNSTEERYITIYSDNNPPEITSIKLNATSPNNYTTDNLTLHYNITDSENDDVKAIINWYRNDNSLTVLNLPFEGGSTESWTRDYSGYRNNATVIGATWNSASGHDGFGAYSLDGDGDYLTVQDSPEISFGNSLNDKPFTLIANVKIHSSNFGISQPIITKSYDGSNREWSFSTNTTHTWLTLFDSNGDYKRTSISNISYITDEWHQIVATYDGRGGDNANHGINIYIDGESAIESYQESNSYTAMHNTNSPLDIGSDARGQAIYTSYANASIDDVQIYNHSLSPEQIKALYENKTDIILPEETYIGDTWHAEVTPNDGTQDGLTNISNNLLIRDILDDNNPPEITSIKLNATSPNNYTTDNLTLNYSVYDAESDPVKLIINWYRNDNSLSVLNLPFEGGSTESWTRDYSGYRNNATVIGATWNSASGHDGFGSYSLDGDGDYLTVQDSPEISFGNSLKDKPFTLIANVKIHSSNFGISQPIITKSYDGSNREWAFNTNVTNTWLVLYDNNGAYNRIFISNKSYNTDEWHQIVAIYDGRGGDNANHGINIYIDGENTSGDYSGSNSYTAMHNTNSPLDIGSVARGQTIYTSYANASIDDVQIYNHSLSPEQIKALHDNITSVVLSEETETGDTWYAEVTPNDGLEEGATNISNNIIILGEDSINNPSEITSIKLNATSPNNYTTDNLTLNYTVFDQDGDETKAIINWYKNNESLSVLNMPFEGGSTGSWTRDYSSTENNGTVNGATWNSNGGYDEKGAYSFDGNDYIIISDNDNLSFGDGTEDSPFTISTWVKTENTGEHYVILSKDDYSTANNREYLLHIFNNNLRFVVLDESINAYCLRSDSDNFFSNYGGEWTHIVATYDGRGGANADQGIDLYINGVLTDDSSSSSGNYVAMENKNQNIEIGARSNSGDYFEGSIDDTVIYQRKLSEDQIKFLYNNRTNLIFSDETSSGEIWHAEITPNDGYQDGKTNISNSIKINNLAPEITYLYLNATSPNNYTTDNLTLNYSVYDADGDDVNVSISWFRNDRSYPATPEDVSYSDVLLNMPFENYTQSSDTYKDISTYSNDGSVTGATWQSTGGYDGYGAYSFDGNDYISIPDKGELSFGDGTSDKPFTISTWIKTESTGQHYIILSKDDYSTANNREYLMDIYNNNLRFVVLDESINAYCLRSDSDNFFSNYGGEWTHIVATYDGRGGANADQGIDLYINGVLTDDSSSSSGNYVAMENKNQNIEIGARSNSDNYFVGYIDDISFYNSLLSPEQIKAIYGNKTNIILSKETSVEDVWYAEVTPNDGIQDGETAISNNITINPLPLPNYEEFDSFETTDFTAESNLSSVPGIILANEYARIQFPEDYHTYAKNQDYDHNIEFGNLFVSVNASGLHPSFNSSANITINNAICPATIYYTDSFYNSSKEIISEKNMCDSETDPSCTEISCDGSSLIFTTSHFTGYATTGTTDLTIWDETDPEGGNKTEYMETEIKFFANYTNTTDIITGATCTIWFNDTDSWNNMVWNSSTSIYEYNKSFETEGTYKWNVTCNKTGYDTISTNDTVFVSNQPPEITSIKLNATSPNNYTTDNLTLNYSVYDADGDDVNVSISWFRNQRIYTAVPRGLLFSNLEVDMPFENYTSENYELTDISKNERNSSLFEASWNSTGDRNGYGSYHFDGQNDYIDLDDFVNIPVNFTISHWFYLENLPISSTTRMYSITNDLDGATEGYGFFINNAPDVIQFRANGLSTSYVPGTTILETDRWYHGVARYNSTHLCIYLDGNLENCVPSTGSVAYANDYTFNIGRRESGSDFHFDGMIDEVKVFNKALSIDQILELNKSKSTIIYSEQTDAEDIWHAEVTPNDGTQDGETAISNNLTINENINSAPSKVNLSYPLNDSSTFNRTPRLIWYNTTDENGDNITYELIISNTSDFADILFNITNISESSENTTGWTVNDSLDVDKTYYWKARAYDGNDYGDFSDIWNFTVDSIVMISLPSNTTEFSLMEPGDSNDTLDNLPRPFLARNDGNVIVDISINGTDLWEVASNPSKYYQFRIGINESNSFNQGLSTMSWKNMTSISAIVDIADLEWGDNNTVEVDFNITVPEGEPPGEKSSTIILTAEVT